MLIRYRYKWFTIFVPLVFLIGYLTLQLQNNADARLEELFSSERSSDYKINVLKEIREKIIEETSGLNWAFTGVRKLEDLLLENGGKPHRTLIVAGWRTGSSFFGELLSQLPASLYYYEPLRYMPTIQIRGPPLAAKAVKIFKNIFSCKHYDVGWNFVKEKENGYSRHFDESLRRIWEYTGGDLQLILNPFFMEKVCSLFPFQIVKELKVRLDAWSELIEDEDLNLNVILLVRDPRGMIQSRRHDDDYCTYEPECIRPEYICADMISDFYAAGRLAKKFPKRIKVIRFEDLTANPEEVTRNLVNSLRLQMSGQMEDFLRTHTQETDAKQRLIRNSKNVAFKWRTLLAFKQVDDIQIACRGAMELWGYQPAHNQTHLTSASFNPVGNYSLRERN